jgi:hypothetical protein
MKDIAISKFIIIQEAAEVTMSSNMYSMLPVAFTKTW